MADDLVFLDKSIFNKKSRWRHYAYALVSYKSRYMQDIKRSNTYAILPTYTVKHGFLPYTRIKKGYYN